MTMFNRQRRCPGDPRSPESRRRFECTLNPASKLERSKRGLKALLTN